MLRIPKAILACLILVFPHIGQAFTLSPDLETRVARNSQILRDLADSIPAHLHDPEALADHLDYQISAAAEHVRTQIHYDPYLGVLRGPSGTISAQAGSSWDQAVLLAGLINTMAGEAQLVRGALSAEDAQRLLGQALAPRPRFAPLISEDRLETLLTPALGAGWVARERARLAGQSHNPRQTIDAQARLLQHSLDQNQLHAPPNLKAHLSEIARNYVWVRYRETPSDAWIDVHPAFGKLRAPQVQPTAYLADQVPQEQLHKIAVRMDIERHEAGRLHRESLMQTYETPVANQALRQLTIGISPATVGTDQEAPYFVPVLNGQAAPDARAFGLLGLTVKAADAAAGPDIFQTISGKLAGGQGILSDTSAPENTPGQGAPRLTGALLTISPWGPGLPRRDETRRLFDFRDERPETASSHITFEGIVDIRTGAENGAWRTIAGLRSQAQALGQIPYYAALMRQQTSAEELIATGAISYGTSPMPWSDMAFLGQMLAPDFHPQARAVRTGAFVSMRRAFEQTTQAGLLVTRMDILHAPVMGLARTQGTATQQAEGQQTGGHLIAAPEQALRQGLKETLIEQYFSTSDNSEFWMQGPVETVLRSPGDLKNWLEGRAIDTLTTDRMNADLKHGRALLLVGQDSDLRWWRFDPSTGHILGMSAAGGSEFVEYLTGAISLGIAMAFAIKGGNDCQANYAGDDDMTGCCLVGNSMLAVAGGAIGAGAGVAIAGLGLSALGGLAVGVTFEFVLDSVMLIPGTATEGVCNTVLGR